jgi:hypothetical protein
VLAEAERKEVEVEPGEADKAPKETAAAQRPRKPSPEPVAQADTRDSASQRTSGSSTRTLGYIIGGVGAASLGTSLVLGLLVLNQKSTVEDQCDVGPPRTCRSQDGIDAASSGATLSTLSTITFGVGIAGLGAGAYFILTSEPSGAETAVSVSGGRGFAGVTATHVY